MQNEDTIIMIKNALLSGDAVASEVLSCLNSLIVSDADPIVGRGDAIEAYSVLRDSRARLPRDESGKRVLSGDTGDKLRERLARVLFHIPLDNLRRRETRVLERDPATSAAPDEERPARVPAPRKPAALPSRCLTIRLNDYDKRELSEIARLTARSMNVDADDAACGAIADRCHGIARYAVAYTRDIVIETTANKDLCERSAAADVEAFFAGRGIDALGLGEEHRNYLKQLRALGFASASSLAGALGENDASELLGTVEPLLLRHGLISISSRGRSLTDKGRRYIGEEV